MKNILSGFIFLMLIATLLMFSPYSQAQKGVERVQDLAADFSLTGIDGQEISLADVLRQRKAVLVFWTTWCPYCRGELRELEKFYQGKKDAVAVIAINVQESKAKVQNYVRKFKLSYPVLLDTEGQVSRLYQVRGVPTVVAVDRDRRVLYSGHSLKEMYAQVDF